jgi:hypothetical protein
MIRSGTGLASAGRNLFRLGKGLFLSGKGFAWLRNGLVALAKVEFDLEKVTSPSLFSFSGPGTLLSGLGKGLGTCPKTVDLSAKVTFAEIPVFERPVRPNNDQNAPLVGFL